MFAFDPSVCTAQFASRGFVHVAGGVTEEFHAALRAQVGATMECSRLPDFAIGQKQQALYEFPDDGDYLGELFDTVSTICGLERDRLVLSERHVKAYEASAAEDVPPHKDRFASQVAVGLTIHVPPGSRVVLYPDDDVEPNPFNSTAELRASLSPDRHPEILLRRARAVEMKDSPRDVLVFRGSAIWHRRTKRTGAVMLYLKLNAFDCDPLGEDPRTAECRARTEETLRRSDPELARAVARIGRRLDRLERRYSREWRESLGAVLSGEPFFAIDEVEFRVLRAIDGRRTVAAVLEVSGSPRESGLGGIRRLAARGVVDLVPPEGKQA